MENRKTVSLLGVQIDVVDTDSLCRRLLEFALEVIQEKQRRVMYVNTDCMLISIKDTEYRAILNKSDLVYADGVGVVWGARLWGHRLPGRVTAADFFPALCGEFAKHGIGIYLLGARPGVADEAAACLRAVVPDLRITGTHHGHFKKEENNKIIDEINRARPQVLIVGFGVPLQEKWIEENAPQLEVPVIWGVGGLFDFISGRTWRGPKWLLDHGFEWLCRFVAEPRRLWRRYLVGNPKFILYLLWHRFFVREHFKACSSI